MTLEVPKTRAERRRFLLVVLALPVAIVASDEALFRVVDWNNNLATVMAFGWLLAQTALVSHLAGRTLPSWPWRLVVLGWTMLLVDLLLYRVTDTLPWHGPNLLPVLLAYAFAASQLAAAVCWATLGATRWQWRLPAVAVVAALAIHLGGDIHRLRAGGIWYWVAAVQVAAVGVLSVALRSKGFRVRQVLGGTSEGTPTSQFFHWDKCCSGTRRWHRS